jgi:signal transduction histidine kinase
MISSEPSMSSDAVQLKVLDYLRREHSLAWAVLSPDLEVLQASERFRDFQWDPTHEPAGRHIAELFWELVGTETGLQEVLDGREPIFSLEDINREGESGTRRYLSLKVLPLLEANPGQGLLLLVQDTTSSSTLEQELVQDRNELRLARNHLALANDELRRLNRLKSLFLSIAAHDLRSPLTAIRGYTDLAIKEFSQQSASGAQEYLSVTLSLVDSLSRLISDFLDVDIIEQGNLQIHPIACNLNAIAREVAPVMGAVAARKGVVVETRLMDDLPAAFADPDRMRQILFNLLGNAIKYTDTGDRVTVETGVQAGSVLLIVRDHGPGIPESEIPHLFDLYHRTAEARKSSVKGLGLGLFIVKSLVDLHRGQISTRSELGQGTEFTVGIPAFRDHPGGNL